MMLIGLLIKLNQKTVTIQLKNGTQLFGIVTGVDMALNTHLKDVMMTPKNNNPINLDILTVRGSNIRHYILPDSTPVQTLLFEEGSTATANSAKNKYAKKDAEKEESDKEEAEKEEGAKERAAAISEGRGRGPGGHKRRNKGRARAEQGDKQTY